MRPARAPEVIHADIGKAIRTLAALHAELAAATGAPSDERVMNIQKAADAVGWSDKTMRRNIIRYHQGRPDRTPWAVQFGGQKKSVWTIYIDRLKGVIASGETFDQ